MDGFAALTVIVGAVVLGIVFLVWGLVRIARQRRFHVKCLMEVRANDTRGGESVDSPKEVNRGQ